MEYRYYDELYCKGLERAKVKYPAASDSIFVQIRSESFAEGYAKGFISITAERVLFALKELRIAMDFCTDQEQKEMMWILNNPLLQKLEQELPTIVKEGGTDGNHDNKADMQ